MLAFVESNRNRKLSVEDNNDNVESPPKRCRFSFASKEPFTVRAIEQL